MPDIKTQLTKLATQRLPAIIKKIEEGNCTQRDIEALHAHLVKAGDLGGPSHLLLVRYAGLVIKNRANLSALSLDTMRKELLNFLSPTPKAKRSGRKPAKGRLRIGVSDVELDKVPVVCQTGASITLSWDSRRKGFSILGAPHSEISIIPQGPNALVLRVR